MNAGGDNLEAHNLAPGEAWQLERPDRIAPDLQRAVRQHPGLDRGVKKSSGSAQRDRGALQVQRRDFAPGKLQ